VLLANLPQKIAQRELQVVQRELGWHEEELAVKQVRSRGPGNALLLQVQRGESCELVSAFGERGVPAEQVAARAVKELSSLLETGAPVGPHLADQLLIPLCLAGEGAFVSGPLTLHARTNIETISSFLECEVQVEEVEAGKVRVSVG